MWLYVKNGTLLPMILRTFSLQKKGKKHKGLEVIYYNVKHMQGF